MTVSLKLGKESIVSTYDVTRVRKQLDTSGSHHHIIGVVTSAGVFYTNREVTDSIDGGNEWYTRVDGEPKARVRKLSFCPATACYHSPYLTTSPDHSKRNNLENLPPG